MLPSRQDRNAARVPQNSSSMAAAEGSGRRQAIKHSCYVLPTRASVRFVPAFERQVFAQRAARAARRVDEADRQCSALHSVQRGMHAEGNHQKKKVAPSFTEEGQRKMAKRGEAGPGSKGAGGLRGGGATPRGRGEQRVCCVFFCVGRGVGEKRHTQQEGSAGGEEWGDKKKSGAGARKRRRGCAVHSRRRLENGPRLTPRRKERQRGERGRGERRVNRGVARDPGAGAALQRKRLVLQGDKKVWRRKKPSGALLTDGRGERGAPPGVGGGDRQRESKCGWGLGVGCCVRAGFGDWRGWAGKEKRRETRGLLRRAALDNARPPQGKVARWYLLFVLRVVYVCVNSSGSRRFPARPNSTPCPAFARSGAALGTGACFASGGRERGEGALHAVLCEKRGGGSLRGGRGRRRGGGARATA